MGSEKVYIEKQCYHLLTENGDKNNIFLLLFLRNKNVLCLKIAVLFRRFSLSLSSSIPSIITYACQAPFAPIGMTIENASIYLYKHNNNVHLYII